VSLIDYRRESIDPAPSLMNITRNLVKQVEIANISIMLYEYVKFYIHLWKSYYSRVKRIRTELIV